MYTPTSDSGDRVQVRYFAGVENDRVVMSECLSICEGEPVLVKRLGPPVEVVISRIFGEA